MLSVEAQNRIRQMNPWILKPDAAKKLIGVLLPANYVARYMEHTTVPPGRALLVTGPRQAGKSTLVWRQIIDFAPNLLFLNIEDPLMRIACTQPMDLIEHLRDYYPFIQAVFVDEVQHLEEAGLDLQDGVKHSVINAINHRTEAFPAGEQILSFLKALCGLLQSVQGEQVLFLIYAHKGMPSLSSCFRSIEAEINNGILREQFPSQLFQCLFFILCQFHTLTIPSFLVLPGLGLAKLPLSRSS